MTVPVEAVGAARVEFGESPLWDAEAQRLLLTDVLKGHIVSIAPTNADELSVVFEVNQPIGTFALRRSGGFVGATDTGVGLVDPTAGHVNWLAPLFRDRPEMRFN